MVGLVLILAAASGFLTARAIGQSGEPTRTVTIEVSGERGPPGPPGPAGLACIQGYSPAIVVFVQQGKGPTRVYTCLED